METKKRTDRFCVWGCVGLFLIFAMFAYLFPYTGDDWDWGSSGGMQRLHTFFDGYNGRYLGNLLVIFLTRNKFFRILFTAISCVAVCVLCNRYGTNGNRSGLLLAAVLFFAMPREMFVQSIAWTSGMVNYVPSTLISLGYLYLTRNITGPKEKICYSRHLWVATLILGFCGGLFVENTTLFNICLAVAVIGYTWLKTKKLFSAHVGFFAGSVLGAVWMFSNSAYHNIAQGEDFYRTTPQSAGETLSRIFENVSSILDYLTYDNKVVCVILGVFVILLAAVSVRRTQQTSRTNGIWLAMAVFCGSLLWIVFEEPVQESLNTILYLFGYTEKWLRLVQSFVAVMFYLSLLAVVFLCVDKKNRFRMMIPLLCIPVSAAPLIVVYPIGPRCVFIGYILMIAFILCLWHYLCPRWVHGEKQLVKIMCAAVAAQCLFYGSIYLPIHSIDVIRDEFVKRQVAEGADIVYICSLPNEDYLQHGTPVSETVFAFFRSFYNIEEGTRVETIHYKELRQMANGYLQ